MGGVEMSIGKMSQLLDAECYLCTHASSLTTFRQKINFSMKNQEKITLNNFYYQNKINLTCDKQKQNLSN